VDRFQSAREVAELLEQRKSPFPVEPEQISAPTSPNVTSRLPARRWKYPAAIAVLATLGLVVCWLSGLFNSKESEANNSAPEPTSESDTKKAATANNRFINSLQMEFAMIPKGKSWLGGGGGSPGKKEIEVAVDFYMGAYEVTRTEWEIVMGAGNNASEFSRTGEQAAAVKTISDADLKRFPIDGVSWDDCQHFVAKLNQMVDDPGWVYRLPTSEEWEYACRGGPMLNRDESRFDYYLDEPTTTLPPGKANYDPSGLKRPCKVGSYPPNKLGLHDMHGNVFEYCNDILAENGQSLRLLVGGCWVDNARFCDAEHRSIGDANGRYTGGGLRLARVPTTGVKISSKVLQK
jgi:formylglycine-generating enzyme required for sulfatase activity